MAFRVVVEGVTGAGKSRTVAALLDASEGPRFPADTVLVAEEHTFGDFMNAELPRADLTPTEKVRRLPEVLAYVAKLPAEVPIILERFHPSYYALLPDWDLYDGVDLALSNAGFKMASLEIPEFQIGARAVARPDRPGWEEGLVGYYGSAQKAAAAVSGSQTRLRAALDMTRLSTVRLNTSAMSWRAYARTIARFCLGPSSRTP